jgi:hypothetical protein
VVVDRSALTARYRGPRVNRSDDETHAPHGASETRASRRAWPIAPTRWPTREEARASRLFSPLRVGALELRTRTWVPAMVPWRASDDGFVTPDVVSWYRRFADGEPGALVLEATGIRDVPSGPLLRIGHARFLPGLRELVDAVRERSHGRTKLFVQLIDFLAIKRRPEKEKFLRRFLVLRDEHRERLRALDARAEHANDDELRELLVRLPHPTLLALLSAREREDLEFGFARTRHRHGPRARRRAPAARAPRALRRRRRARAKRASTASSCTSRTPTRSRRSSRAPTTRTTATGARSKAARACRSRSSRRARARRRDFVVGCRFLGDEAIAGGSRGRRRLRVRRRVRARGFRLPLDLEGRQVRRRRATEGRRSGVPVHRSERPRVHADGAHRRARSPGARGPFGRNLPLARAIRASVRTAGSRRRSSARAASRPSSSPNARSPRAIATWSPRAAVARRSRLVEEARARPRRRSAALQVHQLLRGARPAPPQVTCQLWDRDLTTPDAEKRTSGENPRRSSDGKRRLDAPPWSQG